MSEANLPDEKQQRQWQKELTRCHEWLAAWGHNKPLCWWPLMILAIDAEREALWALVDEMAGRVEDWDDALGAHYRRCGDCLTDWEIGEPEEHCHNCLTGRARALRKAAGR